jgi:hypothetical protein
MFSVRQAVLPLRLLLALTFVLLLLGQLFSLPGQFRHMADEDPDLAYLRWSLTVWSILLVLCVQVVIVCTWRLLTFVERDRIFSHDALAWVDAIVGAVFTALVLFGGFSLFVALNSDDPGTPAALFVLDLVAATFALLLVVMRFLLRQATALRTDLEAVI